MDDPRANAALLILEIGNSHVSVAASVSGTIYTNERFTHDRFDEVIGRAEESWAALPEDRIRAIAACSVVPDILHSLRDQVLERLSQPILVVGESLHRPLSVALDHPESVGIDRLCSAAAAYDSLRHACAVASFGTAITIDCVNDEGAFLGGAILPGVALQAKALHQGTAQLPDMAVTAADGVFGGSTEGAISNGILYGIAGSLREITERFATELGTWPDLIATGGSAELISGYTEIIDRVVPDLCIRGVALAYRKHFSPFDA